MVGEGGGKVARILTNIEVLQNPIFHVIHCSDNWSASLWGQVWDKSLHFSPQLSPPHSHPSYLWLLLWESDVIKGEKTKQKKPHTTLMALRKT